MQRNMNNPKKINKKNKKDNNKGILGWIILTLAILWMINIFTTSSMVSMYGGVPKEMSYGEFSRILEEDASSIKSLEKIDTTLRGEMTNGERFFTLIPEEDSELISLIRKNVYNFTVKSSRNIWANLLFSFGPVLLFILLFWYLSMRGSEMGNRLWSFGKARTRAAKTDKDKKVTFKDVAGVDEAKEELSEVIEFLKDPKRFQRLGGRFPKGVLLVGPPGCGKTLLAKAVAGEASVPFFSISGSDFVEMFVGVGASRVRDLFDQAKKAAKLANAGSIIFIDELDAVGRQRFAGLGGGHDEREQTLNQLLTEMDGFQTEAGVLVMAATNRPDTLDLALLRKGRFDRYIVVDRPDIKGREGILKVHTKKIKLSKDVNLAEIAKRTSLFSGADLENLCNEAALLAARDNKEAVGQSELEESIERVMMGPEKKSKVVSAKDKKITAFHEAGHALLSLLIPEVDSMAKVSIIPRGIAGGYTFMPPIEDRQHIARKELLGRIMVALGGRVSEEISLDDITTGASQDLSDATKIARYMICDYGMSERLGKYTLGKSHEPIFLGRDLARERDYSEETAKIVDEEVKRIIDECYAKAKKLIQDNKEKLTILANALVEKEVLDAEEVRKLIGLEVEEDKKDKPKPNKVSS
ncbi:ATP-dependent zinc metalloprotease FtsH [Candidatus Omnitrophota bacterium]